MIPKEFLTMLGESLCQESIQYSLSAQSGVQCAEECWTAMEINQRFTIVIQIEKCSLGRWPQVT